MSNYIIIGDSCCDYTDDERLNFITRVPLSIQLDGKEYVDDESLDCTELIEKISMSPQAPKSACPAPSSFTAAIGNHSDAYIVTLSDKVSGTYNSALLGAEMAKEENPLLNVHVFNSHSAAAGEIAVCCKIRELIEQGLSFDAVVEKVEKYIQRLTTFFVLETLDVFRKNGRLSHLQAIATAALKIRLIMGADDDGAIVIRGKALTMSRALKGLIDQIKARCEQLSESGHEILYITHCACRERADELKTMIMDLCPAIKDIIICTAGGISTIYANAGGVIIGF